LETFLLGCLKKGGFNWLYISLNFLYPDPCRSILTKLAEKRRKKINSKDLSFLLKVKLYQ